MATQMVTTFGIGWGKQPPTSPHAGKWAFVVLDQATGSPLIVFVMEEDELRQIYKDIGDALGDGLVLPDTKPLDLSTFKKNGRG